MGIRQSMGRVGSCFDNAAAEAFFSSLEWEVLSRNGFDTLAQARTVVLDWCYGFYNHVRHHSTIGMVSPINYENAAALGGTPIRHSTVPAGTTHWQRWPVTDAIMSKSPS
jgi:transposase InsO family protein